MADSVEEIKKARNKYILVGTILFVFTVVTVAVATVPWLDFGGHGFDAMDAVIGLIIATFKATLVALIFMHLNHEKRSIYLFIVMAAVGAASLVGLTAWAFIDPIEYGKGDTRSGSGFYNPANTEEGAD